MNKNLLLVAGVAILGFSLLGKVPGCSTPLNKPSGPDMVFAFTENASRSGEQARHDAEVLSTLCQALHDYLEDDWRADKPFLNQGVQVDNLRIIARKVRTKNQSLSESYPALSGVLEEHFTRHVGKSGGPLTDETKRGWLEAFKQLAECSEYASKAL